LRPSTRRNFCPIRSFSDFTEKNLRGLGIENCGLDLIPALRLGTGLAAVDSVGEPSGDHRGNLLIVLFRHDHVPVAVDAVSAPGAAR
jgi:hypothetical protein